MAFRGWFLTFEGPEGSGKSTHIRLLASYLKKKGYTVVTTREPGGTALATELRRILLKTGDALSPMAELFLYEADRAQHVDEVILPALRRGQVVLCDRFTDSTLAYQGHGRGLDVKTILTLNRIAAQALVPDLTVLLDVPVERGLRQAGEKKHGHDRLERAGLAFHRRVREGYRAIGRREKRRVRLIAQQSNPDDTQRLVREAVDQFFSVRRTSRRP